MYGMALKPEDMARLSHAARQWSRLARGEKAQPHPEGDITADLTTLVAQIGGLVTTLQVRAQVGKPDARQARLLWEGRHIQALLMKAVFAPPEDTTLRMDDELADDESFS